MRKDIEFAAGDGTTLRGWLFMPDDVEGPAATVVMSHGFSAVKEMYLDRFAEVFAAAGLAALAAILIWRPHGLLGQPVRLANDRCRPQA